MGFFDAFKLDKVEPKKSDKVVERKTFSKEKCDGCGKQFGESRIYHTYQGKKKGSFEIIKERVLCKVCLEKQYDTGDREPDVHVLAKIMIAMELFND